MKKYDSVLGVFLKKLSIEDCIIDYDDVDYGCATSILIDDIEFIYGARELTACGPDFQFHWFIDSYGNEHSFVLNSLE